MRKFFTLFLTFAFLTVQVNAATQNSLKSAFDELNYSLSVEWDQKDRNFYDAQMEKFTAQVKSLQAEGLSNSELIEFAKSQIKDPNVAKDLDTAFTMITLNNMNPAEARKFVLETMMNNSYAKGASWAGDVLYVAIVVVVVAAIILAAASGGVTVVSSPGYGCYNEYVCYDYYDYYWGYYTDCYYQTVCY